MEEMKRLVKKYDKMAFPVRIALDEDESRPGYFVVEKEWEGFGETLIFKNRTEFECWVFNVLLY